MQGLMKSEYQVGRTYVRNLLQNQISTIHLHIWMYCVIVAHAQYYRMWVEFGYSHEFGKKNVDQVKCQLFLSFIPLETGDKHYFTESGPL